MAIDTRTRVEEEETLLSLGLPGGFSIPVLVVQKQRGCCAPSPVQPPDCSHPAVPASLPEPPSAVASLVGLMNG